MSLARFGARMLIRAANPLKLPPQPVVCRLLSSAQRDDLSAVCVEETRYQASHVDTPTKSTAEKVVLESCSDDIHSYDDEMEQEEMFVDPHESFEHGNTREWGGPRRGGRLPEPTRFGDWERKGRCSDF